MAKTLGQVLYGLTLEAKKKIREEIKSAQSARAQEGSATTEAYWDGLSALAKSVQDLVDTAKVAGNVPKGTTIEKLSKIPKTKPKRWDAFYNKLFSRKPRTAKPAAVEQKNATQNKKVTAKAKTPKKKTQSKAGRQ